MVLSRRAVFLGLLLFHVFLFWPTKTMPATDCPLDLSGANFTAIAPICSSKEDRAKCCRYINAFIAVSIARYANITSSLGVAWDLSQICLSVISDTLDLYGVTRNATVFCGLGTKIPVNYECQGRTTVTQMVQTPKFMDVTENCQVPLSVESKCKQCLNAGILYLRNLTGAVDNMTLSTCRDAAFVALGSQVDNVSTIDIASCFFGVQELMTLPGSSPALLAPEAPSPLIADSPSQHSLNAPLNGKHHPYRLTLIPGLGIAVTGVVAMVLVLLIFLICRKNRELKGSETMDKSSLSRLTQHPKRYTEGPSSMFQKFSYKETMQATDKFNTIIGRGGYGTVYKAQFRDGFVAAVKRLDKVSEQAEAEFCGEIELLARLHHRHLVTLRGFCVMKHESRILVYEYMANGNLRDHLRATDRSHLSWRTRIQIAIDVANALEYLHLYCNPPLCHGDIKSSNILLDENLVAKVADFGLARALKDGLICFEPGNTNVKGTSGYMDPEYVITQELTEKSDVYSYGVVLLELVTARGAIQDNKNLVEWAEVFMSSDSWLPELVDPTIADSFDFGQLQTVMTIVRWCTQREGKARPSIKQVLCLLYECLDPLHGRFIEALEDGGYEGAECRAITSTLEKMYGDDAFIHSGGDAYLASSSTSKSHCNRRFLLQAGSPQSPSGIVSN
ncbi:Non-specific serine/threonine protein kinase [Bertholletia excelsa]